MEGGTATISQPPALRERAVNSYCGYWVSPYDATANYQGTALAYLTFYNG
jgi:hypothetical protein